MEKKDTWRILCKFQGKIIEIIYWRSHSYTTKMKLDSTNMRLENHLIEENLEKWQYLCAISS